MFFSNNPPILPSAILRRPDRPPRRQTDQGISLGYYGFGFQAGPNFLARLRGFEPSAAGGVFAFVPELRCGQALAARIRDDRLAGRSK